MTFSVWRLFILVLVAARICVAQSLCDLPTKARGFMPPSSADAYTVLDAIGKVVPFQTRTIRVFPSSNYLVTRRGAAAQLCGTASTERWIFYDPTYIEAIKPTDGKSDLPRYFVLAHEAAHHINGDTLLGNDWNRDQELAADYSAAVWLTRLGVTLQQLLNTFDALGLTVESVNGYPTLAERRAKVIEGYENTVATVPPPPPAGDNFVWSDPATGLIWTKRDSDSNGSWQQAADYCHHLDLDGHSDWRLPEISELRGIYDPSVGIPGRWPNGYAVTWHVKGDLVLTGWEWSNTQGVTAGEAWGLYFNDGHPTSNQLGYTPYGARALCVRRR
jgi:Protein of unknown function (DUF1566)